MALYHYHGFVESNATGKAQNDVVVRIYTYPGNIAQSVFSDDLSTPKPLIVSDENGAFDFYIEGGRYDVEYVVDGNVQDRKIDVPMYAPVSYNLDAETIAMLETAQAAADRAEIAAENAQQVLASELTPGAALEVPVSSDGAKINPFLIGFHAGGTLTLDPRGTPYVTVDCYDPGYDTAGNPAIKRRTLVGTVAGRNPYPNQTVKAETETASGLEKQIWLSEPIYAASSFDLDVSARPPFAAIRAGAYVDNGVSGTGASSTQSYRYCLNTSSRQAEPITGNWTMSANQRVFGSFEVEAFIDSFHPYDNQTLACVVFKITDSAGNVATARASTMAQSGQTTTPVPVWKASIDTTALIDGDGVLSFTAYPWVGNAWTSADDGITWKTPQVCDIPVLIDNSGDYAPMYACLSTTGNDGTAVSSAVQATAEASPYLTMAALLTGLQAANNVRGHNDLDAGFVLLSQDIAGWTMDISAKPINKVWLTVKPKSGVAVKTIGMTDTATAANRKTRDLVAYEDLYLRSATTGRAVLDGVNDGAVSGKPTVYNRFKNCKIESVAATSTPPLYTIGLKDMFDCEVIEGGSAMYKHFGNQREHWRLIMGGMGIFAAPNSSTGHAWTVLGFNCPYIAWEEAIAAASNVQPTNGMIVGFNKMKSMTASVDIFSGRQHSKGVYVNNVVEKVTGVSSACTIGAGDPLLTQSGIIVRHNTIPGERTNYFYNDNTGLTRTGCLQYNLWWEANCKGDFFASAANVGNWPIRFGLFVAGNHSIDDPSDIGASVDATAENYKSWYGDFAGLRFSRNAAVSFTNDQSFQTTGAGGGTYSYTSTANVVSKVPASRAAYPFDIAGVARKNDGSGCCGAYEG